MAQIYFTPVSESTGSGDSVVTLCRSRQSCVTGPSSRRLYDSTCTETKGQRDKLEKKNTDLGPHL